MPQCKYYCLKESRRVSERTDRKDRNPRKPIISKRYVCTHPELIDRPLTIGPLQCNGDRDSILCFLSPQKDK